MLILGFHRIYCQVIKTKARVMVVVHYYYKITYSLLKVGVIMFVIPPTCLLSGLTPSCVTHNSEYFNPVFPKKDFLLLYLSPFILVC